MPRSRNASHPKILIVDDDLQNRYLLRTISEGMGASVEEAINGQEALNQARSSRPDLVISDALMPVMDGFALCHEWVNDEFLKGIPFVFYTSTYTDLEDEQLAKSLGASRFIRKPAEPAELIRIIQEVLSAPPPKAPTAGEEAVILGETEYMKAYSERLVIKLEHKAEQLAESEARYKALFEDSAVAMFEGDFSAIKNHLDKLRDQGVVDLRGYLGANRDTVQEILNEGKVRNVNRAAVLLQRAPNKDALIGPVGANLAPEAVDGFLDEVLALYEGTKLIEKESISRTFDGRHLDVLVRIGLPPGAEESLDVVHISLIDITHRKLAIERLRRTLEGTVGALGTATEVRDPYTAGHQKRVTKLALAIAKELGLEEEQQDSLRLAGLMHDIGKLAIPAEILGKPARLTEIEFAMIREHPNTGYEILKQIEFEGEVAEIVCQHHERADGSGYPAGLAGDHIRLEARILSVADVVEAMASHRPYRPTLGIEAALDEIKGKRGDYFDSGVVDACVRVIELGQFSFDD